VSPAASVGELEVMEKQPADQKKPATASKLAAVGHIQRIARARAAALPARR
jgi:hypothetical protein